MSNASAESALQLHQAVLGHDTWNEDMPELAGFTREGYIAIDCLDDIEPSDLPTETLSRLRATPDESGGSYEIVLGRKVNSRYGTLSNLYGQWSDGQTWDADMVYEHAGRDVSFVRVSRVSGELAVAVHYFASTVESNEPNQPPLCEASVGVEDRTSLRKLVIETGEKGGSIVDFAKALHIDPMTGKPDEDLPKVTSEVDFRVNLAESLGDPLSHDVVDALHQDEEVARLMADAEQDLQPLTSEEVLAIAALVRNIETISQF